MPLPDLYPIPFVNLVARLDRELAAGGSVYAYPRKQWWVPDPARDLSMDHFGFRLGNPAGPASGPHTQLAQNLVMSWLGGARFMELKTVQILDELEIPRPCIFVPHVGYNVEWSQELRVPQSAEEYVKGWLLLHMLADDTHGPGLWPSMDAMFDMSIGYDLAGIQSPKVANFIHTMQDAQPLIDKLRAELPPHLAHWGEVAAPSKLCSSVTLSTFHGCPADEIEAIATHTMREHGMHTVVKLNPTLLGYERVCDIVNNQLGYDQVKLSPEPFEKDLQWDQLMEMIPRLETVAAEVGVGFGVKFTNTLVMQSEEPPFGEGEMYLSGAPLHVLALTLAAQFRDATHERIPITFSAGVDASNFHELVGAGLAPVTSCSDLLKSKGYARLSRYLRRLEKTMAEAEATTLDELRCKLGDDADPQKAAAKRLAVLGANVAADKRYQSTKNSKSPRKVGSHLETFDCLTCDICIPVCPNGANFTYDIPKGEHTPGMASWGPEGLQMTDGETLNITKRHQIANLADACNLCGQCDPWCPEDGGPYLAKPTLFLNFEAFADHSTRDGVHIDDEGSALHWRHKGDLYTWTTMSPDSGRLRLPNGSSITLEGDTPTEHEGEGSVDLTMALSMRLFLDAMNEGRHTTFLGVNSGSQSEDQGESP